MARASSALGPAYKVVGDVERLTGQLARRRKDETDRALAARVRHALLLFQRHHDHLCGCELDERPVKIVVGSGKQ